MAGWTGMKSLGAVLLGLVAACACVQAEPGTKSPSGGLSGKLTDLQSRPLEGVEIVLHNEATGAETRAQTGHGGVYRFNNLDPGAYTLRAEKPALGQGQVGGIVVAAGHEAHVQAAIDLEPGTVSGPEKATAAGGVAMPDAPPSRTRFIADELGGPGTAKPVFVPEARPAVSELAPVHPAVAPPVESIAAGNAVIPETPMAQWSIYAMGLRPDAVLALAATPTVPRTRGPFAVNAVGLAVRVAISSAVSAQVARSLASSLDGVETTTFTSDEIEAMPLAGRDWESAAVTVPPPASHEAGADDSRKGNLVPQVAVTVDGASMGLAFGAGNGRSRTASLIGPGATDTVLREVRTAAGDEAGMVRGAGAHATLETKRGTDAWHGQVFLFSRQNLWGAQNPFTQWVKQTAPAAGVAVPVFTPEPYTPGDQEETWSASAGGRVRHSGVYWFASLDGLHRDAPAVATVKHPDNFFAQPTNDDMQVLAARLGLSSIDPLTEGVQAYSGLLQTLGGLLGPAPRQMVRRTGFGRVDWARGERQRFTLEGTETAQDAPGGGLSRASESYGTHSFGSSHIDEQWLLGRWQRMATANLLFVTQGAFGHHVVSHPAETPSSYERLLNVNAWGQLPQIVVDSRYGFTIGKPARFGPGSYPDERLYQAQEQMTWLHGHFTLRAGADFSHNTDTTTFLRNQTGTFHYASVESFASDALAFGSFGLNGLLNATAPHNCDQTGKAWRDSAGELHGLGNLPCYSWYTQTMGPNRWWLGTNDWASYVTVQWRPQKDLTVSLGLRWEREQTPPALWMLDNPELPLTEKLPSLGDEWAPRASMAWGKAGGHWPVLRIGYGMYFGRTPNALLEAALTQTGSLKGDLNYFIRPTDGLGAGGVPPFPYVFAGEPAQLVKPNVAEFAAGFRNGAAHQAVASLEQTLPSGVHVDASAVVSLGRRLPVTLDGNIDAAASRKTITYAVRDGNGSGPIKAEQITLPFYAAWPATGADAAITGWINPQYEEINQIASRANSTYEAGVVRITRNSRHGLTLRGRYTFAHAADWNPDESTTLNGPSVFDPLDLREDYGASDLDLRQSASASATWQPRWLLGRAAGRLANGWVLSGMGTFRSGLPYTMRTAGALAKEFTTAGAAIVALEPGINGYGGDNRMYGVGRNTYRYPGAWKADLRLARRFNLGEMGQLELLAESFNLFNHRNVTELETVGYTIESGGANGSLPTLNFLTGIKSGQAEFGQPLNVNGSDYYRQRQIQFGVKMTF